MNIDKNEIMGIHFFFRSFRASYMYEDGNSHEIYGQPYYHMAITNEDTIYDGSEDDGKRILLGEELGPK